MPDFEFDVDASIAAGWERFAVRLAGFLRDLVPGAIVDLTVPVLGSHVGQPPFIRFTASDAADTPRPAAGPRSVEAEVSGGGTEDDPIPLRTAQLDQLAGLGWEIPNELSSTAGPRLRLPAYEAGHLAHLVAGTMERVFGIPHPVFLHDVVDPDAVPQGSRPGAGPHDHHETALTATAGPAAPVADDVDFRPITITDPDQATRAVGAALSDVYNGRVEADEHDVFTVPAGCVVLFVRAHRSMPLIVFRSPLVSTVEDAAAAETEVAILNRDSQWCRYVFDGKTIVAESEFVDRVFVPVNFKIQLAEIVAELDDVYSDLARRVAGKQWRDLHSADDSGAGEQ